MSGTEQVVVIAALATSFTAVCEVCASANAADGLTGSTFAGRLDPDLEHGTFLCRRGHLVRVERGSDRAEAGTSAAA
jgi:hypothetical protein